MRPAIKCPGFRRRKGGKIAKSKMPINFLSSPLRNDGTIAKITKLVIRIEGLFMRPDQSRPRKSVVRSEEEEWDKLAELVHAMRRNSPDSSPLWRTGHRSSFPRNVSGPAY